MVAGVIVTHGSLATALLESAALIVGELEGVEAVCLSPGEGPETCREKIERSIDRVDEGDGIVLFADLPGGTPCNVGLTCVVGRDLEVVTGVNLSMLVKFPSLRAADGPLREIARKLGDYGVRSIRVASEVLRPREGSR